MSVASSTTLRLKNNGNTDEASSVVGRDLKVDESDFGTSNVNSTTSSTDAASKRGGLDQGSKVEDTICLLVDLLFQTLDARKGSELETTKYQEVAKYQNSSAMSATSLAILEKRRLNAQTAQRGAQRKELAFKNAIATFVDEIQSKRYEASKRSDVAVDTSLGTFDEKCIQTKAHAEGTPSDLNKEPEAKETENTNKMQMLVTAVVAQSVKEVKSVLPALVVEQCKIREQETEERQRQEGAMPLLALQNSVQYYLQNIRKIEQQIQMINNALASLNEEAKQLREAFERRQTVDKDLFDILQNHSVNIGRHEETLFHFVEIISSIPQPRQNYGTVPLPGITDELQRAAEAAAAASTASVSAATVFGNGYTKQQ